MPTIAYQVNERIPQWAQDFLRSAIVAAGDRARAHLMEMPAPTRESDGGAAEMMGSADAFIFDLTHDRTQGWPPRTNPAIDARVGYALGSRPARPIVLLANSFIGLPDLHHYPPGERRLFVFHTHSEFASIEANVEREKIVTAITDYLRAKLF